MNEIISSTIDEAVDQLNKLRLASKDTWVFALINLNGLSFYIKFFNTSIQRFETPCGNLGGTHDLSVKAFKDELHRGFSC